jgi:hypothetical protein
MAQRNSEESVQSEIKEEDRKFLTSGIFFVVGLIAVLLVGGFLLLRLVIVPLFHSILGALRPSQTPVATNPSPAPANENTPIIKDIDAIPYNWQRIDIPEIGISLATPPESTVSASGNTATLKMSDTTLTFAQKVLAGSELEDEAGKIRNNLNDNNSDTTLVEKTDIAGITAYSFKAEKDPQDQHLLLSQTANTYVEVIIPDLTDKDETRAIIDNILTSIKFIQDSSPLTVNQ